jgi:diguanylate cyclase (GGDEF)-like protein
MPDKTLLSELLSASGDAAYDWDLRADHINWYGAWDKLFGTSALPPPNSEGLYNVIHADDRHLVFGGEEKTLDRQYRLQAPNGQLLWVHERGRTESEQGHVTRQSGVLRIIARPQEKAITADAQGYDALTGCLNRMRMLEHIDKAQADAAVARRNCAYMVVGIDKMSFVNEAVGMEAGDVLLRSVAARLAEIMPPRATLARTGGDMFGILLPEQIGIELPRLADRVLQSFRDHPVVTSVTPLHITVSIGGVRLPAVAKSAPEAMIYSEQALHEARQRGRNLFVEYLDQPERAHENRQMLELGERIKHAFKHDGFRLAYQPVIDTLSGRVLFYEALVRMFDDQGRTVPAAQFVPAIEQLGMAFDLDCRVLDLAVKELEAQPDLTLAINVSGLTASTAAWPEHVQRILGLRGPVAQRTIFEITETAAIVDVGETRRFVDQIRKLGGRVALDDFGAGFTSIRHLRALAVSIMKIDKDLLHNLVGNAEQQHLVRMLIELARGLGLKTVAEGVETEDIAAWLRREKVDMMQGYYFGKPALERPWLAGKGNGGANPAAAKPSTLTVVARA